MLMVTSSQINATNSKETTMRKSQFQCHGKSPKLATDNRPKLKEREELQAQIDEWLSSEDSEGNSNIIKIVASNEPVRASNYGR